MLCKTEFWGRLYLYLEAEKPCSEIAVLYTSMCKIFLNHWWFEKLIAIVVVCICCRQMFSDIRLFIDELSASARCPAVIRTILQKTVSIVSNFAPPIVTAQWHLSSVTSTLSVSHVYCSMSISIYDRRWRYFQFCYSMPKGTCVFILVMLSIYKMCLHARPEVILY